MSFKYQQIKKIFTDLEELKIKGIWYSGIKWEGEYKSLWKNGKTHVDCFYIDEYTYKGEYRVWWRNGQLNVYSYYNDDGQLNGDYKYWDSNGKLIQHKIYNKDGSLKETIL